jgi:biotin carboxyl carrier protein
MRRYQVNFPGRDEPLTVELLSDDGEKAHVRVIDGETTREMTLDIASLEAGVRVVTSDTRVDRVDVMRQDKGWLLLHGWEQAELKVTEERDTWLGSFGGADGEGVVTVAMPGKVVTVDVEAGQEVTRGQRLLVIEAMKMENDVKSPRDGVVATVHVNTGDAVEAGQALIELE